MAAVQQPRITRSARLIANLTRSRPQSSNATPGAASHASGPNHGIGSSHGLNGVNAHVQLHSPSALSLFLTNLRLLDLDLRPDWPGICAETFAAGGTSAQGQKKRVQAVEWALFHLFALWDPDETRNKLKPFFPALDQVQSVNLRAALLRALEQAKKNGVLGRDAIVRKTMLDECKGERLEEVLAAFSSAVLKHVVQDDFAASGEHTALAAKLAVEDRGYKGDNTELVSMVLTHRAALSGVLRNKHAANARFRDFSELLSIKERGLVRKKEAIQAKEQNEGHRAVSDDAKLGMWRTIRNNWSGNERWMETVLYGDAGAKKDGLLSMPYDRVWRRVQQGRLAELEEHGTGLLEQLDDRVRTQQERLQKWESFHRRLCEDRPRPSPSKQTRQASKTKGIDLGFGAHEALQVGRASPRKPTIGGQRQILSNEYHELVRDLENDLMGPGPSGSSSLAFLQRPSQTKPSHQRNLSAANSELEVASEVSELDDEEGFSTSPPMQSFQAKFAQTKRQPVLRPKISLSGEWFAANTASVVGSRSSTETLDDTPTFHPDPQRLSPQRHSSPEGDDDPTPVAGSPERYVIKEREKEQELEQEQHVEYEIHTPPRDMSPSPTQDLADQILESMEQATPSPTKRSKPRHTLSLAERTRLSMARGPFVFPDHDEPDLPLNLPPVNPGLGGGPRRETLIVDDHDDLTSRTRKSMAGFEKAKQKAQLERRRSLRKSKVPPRKEGSYFPRVPEEEKDHTMLAEELMVEEDMEAVFRSRPKIKASPIPSPTREWDADEYM